jgi:PAS domain S-box-containing protein
LGYSRDELLQLNVLDLLPDTSTVNMPREDVLREWRRWEPSQRITIQAEHRRKDGTALPVQISTSVVHYEGQQVILAIVTDVTERRQTERYQALSVEVLSLLNEAEDTDESLQRALTALLRVTGCDAAAVHLQEGDAVACRALTGFPNDFFRSEDCLLCREPEAAQRADSDSLLHADCACSLVLSGRTDPSDPTSTKAGSIWTNDAFANMQPPRPSTSTCIPLHLRCLDAGYRSMAIIPIPARTGILGLLHLHGYAGGLFTLNAIHALEGIASHLGEMLQRQQTERALYESEERFRSLYSNTAIGLYRTTPDGRILLANPALVRMLGYSSFRDLAQRDLTRNGYEPGYLRREFVDHMARDGEVQGLESAWTRKDGTTLSVRESCCVIRDADGRPLYYDGTAEDITERKRAEEAEQALRAQLIQAQKLESIGTLASGVAHEINNPLMGVINYADLIQERVEDAETKLFAQGIQDEGNRIAGIVKSLLSFARQDAAHSSPARVVDIIDAAMSLTAVALRRDRIQLEKDVPDTLPDISCRSQQIQQVVINLLTNARDALNDRYPEAHEDKRIRIAARPFNKKGESWLRVTIEDHGTGIPRDMLARLFDPFFTTKPRDRGTGLGLSVSHGIIESHQGTLWVESRLGEYTRFHIELPTTKQQEAQRAED